MQRCPVQMGAAPVTLTTTPTDAADYVAMSGQQLYTRFCASCHGLEGHGDGPVAQSFASKVPDITLIARRHGGEFPGDWVERTIDGRQRIGAHGAYTMPVWGEDFSRTDIGRRAQGSDDHSQARRLSGGSAARHGAQTRRRPRLGKRGLMVDLVLPSRARRLSTASTCSPIATSWSCTRSRARMR
jgi:mono/diheme cytochrome c family protein